MKIRKKDVFFVFLLSLTLILNACSTLSDSLILGVGSGAIVGGAVSRQTHKDANSGMAIGAAAVRSDHQPDGDDDRVVDLRDRTAIA